MSSDTPRLVTSVWSKKSCCSSFRLRRAGRPASVTQVLLSDSFLRLHGAHKQARQHT